MKTFTLTYFILLTMPLFSLTELGQPTTPGYREIIYSTVLDESLFTSGKPTAGNKTPTETNLSLIYMPYNWISFEFYRDNNLYTEAINLFPVNNSLFAGDLLSFVSQNSEYNEAIIHHLFYIKKEGLLSSGITGVYNFSLLNRNGYKLINFNSIKLHYLKLYNYLEYRKDYITPSFYKEEDIFRIKNRVSIKNIYIEPELIYIFTLNTDDTLHNYLLKLNFPELTPDFFIYMGINQKTLLQYVYGGEIMFNINRFKLGYNLDIKYINWPVFDNEIKFDFTFLENFKFESQVKSEYITDFYSEYSFKISFRNNIYNYYILFNQLLDKEDYPWELEGGIKLNRN